MKNLLFVSLFAGLLLFSLFMNAQQVSSTSKGAKQTSNAKSAANMRGAYYMLKQVVNDGNADSVLENEQLKIYTDRYFMYAHGIVGDSLAAYGIGTYKVESDKLVEYVFFTSGNGDRKDTVNLYVTKRPDGYTQVINFPLNELGRKFALTEDYKTVSKNMSTPLDGAWKQTKNIFYPTGGGAPITNEAPTQFKVYMAGHFIWANTSKDSTTQKPVSRFGFGTFDMKGAEAVETNTHSSYSTLTQQPTTLRIEFSGKDSYTQSINFPEGRLVEVYQRMK